MAVRVANRARVRYDPHMKKLIFVSLFLIGACGGGSKKPETTTTTTDPNTPVSNTDPNQPAATPTGDGTPCEQEIALQCPEAQIDACLKTPREGNVHKCVAK